MIQLEHLLKKYKEEKIIKLICKKKIKYSNEEILYAAIDFNKNKIVKHIIENEKVDLNYKTYYDTSILAISTIKGNLIALDLLKKHNIDLCGEYKTTHTTSNNLCHIQNLETLKYFEKNVDREILKKNLDPIISYTIFSNDIELLDYIIKNYKLKLNKLNYNLKDNVESYKNRMKERENKLRDKVFFTLEILPDKRKYKIIRNNALERLDSISKENEKIEKYYNYIEKCYEEEKWEYLYKEV